jgi:glutaredoxin
VSTSSETNGTEEAKKKEDLTINEQWGFLSTTLSSISDLLSSMELRVKEIEDNYLESVLATLGLMESGKIPRNMLSRDSVNRKFTQDILLSILVNPDEPLESNELLMDIAKMKQNTTFKPISCPHCKGSLNLIRRSGEEGDTLTVTSQLLLEEEDRQIFDTLKTAGSIPAGVAENSYGGFTSIDTHPKPTPNTISGVNLLQTEKIMQFLLGEKKGSSKSDCRNTLYPPMVHNPQEYFESGAVFFGKQNQI